MGHAEWILKGVNTERRTRLSFPKDRGGRTRSKTAAPIGIGDVRRRLWSQRKVHRPNGCLP